MSGAIVTEVRGTGIVDKKNVHSVPVGKIFSEQPLDSNEFEVVSLEFDPEYNGISASGHNQGGAVLTFAKTIGGYDKDIVSPIVLVTTGYRISPVHTLISGIIARIDPPPIKKGITVDEIGLTTITIVLPGKERKSVEEWTVTLPKHLRLNRKVVYIKQFDMYIGACSDEQMRDIRAGKALVPRLKESPKALVEISVRGSIDVVKKLHFCFKGIFGEVPIQPSMEPVCTITLRVGGEVLITHVSNTEFLNMKNSICKVWDNLGGIELLLDVDPERIRSSYQTSSSLVGKSFPTEAIELINKLRTENASFAGKISDMGRKLRENEITITEMNGKLTESESRLRIQQEDFKTRREEIKYQGSIADQRNATVMDTIKLGGVLLGTIALVVNIASKLTVARPIDKVSKLIEWSVPVLFKKCAIASVGTAAKCILGGIVGIGGIIASAIILKRLFRSKRRHSRYPSMCYC